MGANKPVAPASLLQVGGAGRVVGKKSLELWERLWEPKIATLVNVHEHGRTLPLVAVGDNRIGKVRSPAAAQRLTRGLWGGLAVSAALALIEAWLGITLAFYTDWPVSFCIAVLSALGYFAALNAPFLRAAVFSRKFAG